MEGNGDAMLDEFVARTWETHPFDHMNSFFSTGWGFDRFSENLAHTSLVAPPPPEFQPIQTSFEPFFNELWCQDLMGKKVETTSSFGGEEDYSMSAIQGGMKVAEKRKRAKKVEGQPSKNLMAERRRRKRLNDRLSMLRSIVPKITKMDRTSILGDTIDYMKELVERINNLREESDASSGEINEISIFNDQKHNEALIKNSPKFEVERRKSNTRVEISCSAKPGILLSTVTTLEALGLEIQQCVISCFNDFSLHAVCSEDFVETTLVKSEDMKQALFKSAGYGGRCL